MKRIMTLLIVSVLTTAGLPAFAQSGQQPGPGKQDSRYEDPDFAPGGYGPASGRKWEDVRKKMETVRIWRLTEELKLDEKTSTKLAALLGSLSQQRGALMREKHEVLRELQILLKSEKRSERAIKAAVEKVMTNQDRLADLRKREYSDIRGILSIEQQAQYLIFQQEFQREMRGMIAGARGQGRGGKGMRGGMNRPGGPNAGSAPPSNE